MSRLRRREARNVSIDFLEPHPDNIRKELGPTEDLDELGASMRSQGVLQALLVTPHPAEDGVFVVIDGHRRLAAARRAHVFDLPCIVTEPGATPGQVLTAMVAADIRRPLAPIELAKAFQRLRALGLSVRIIAERTGHSQRTVNDRLRLLALPEQVQHWEHVISDSARRGRHNPTGSTR